MVLIDVIRERQDLKLAEGQIKKQIEELDEFIKKEVGEEQTKFCEEFEVSYKKAKRPSVDTKKLKEQFNDAYQLCIADIEFMSLKIKKRK